MNIQFADTTNAADDAAAIARQRAADLIDASKGIDHEEIKIILGMKPMERKLSKKAKVGLSIGAGLGVVGLLAVGIMSENKLGVVEKIVGAASGAYNAVTGLFTSATPSA